MKNSFKIIVDSADLIAVRVALSHELMLDPRGLSFHEMLSYAESILLDLYEEDDNEQILKEKTEWNSDYLDFVKGKLDFNFSKQKLSLYEQVAKAVLKEKAERLNMEEFASQNQDFRGNIDSDEIHYSGKENGRPFNEPERLSGAEKLHKGLSVAGVAVTVLGLITTTAIAVIGVAATAVGVASMINDLNKKTDE